MMVKNSKHGKIYGNTVHGYKIREWCGATEK